MTVMFLGSEILLSLSGNQKKGLSFFFASVSWFTFFLKYFPHMNNHIDKVGSVTFVETISMWNGTSEKNCKIKHLTFLGSY